MRRSLFCVLLALVLSSAASAAARPAASVAVPRVSAFYYPWYGTPTPDGAYQHWNQDGHAPPNNIASAYYPLRGVYSSSNALVVSAQMDEIRSAGIDQIDVSWWGQGSAEDQRMPLVVADARTDGITVAAHLEPYGGRTVASTVADMQYLEQHYGIRTFYVYRAPDFPAAEWAAAQTAIHASGGVTDFAQTGMVGWAAAAGFDGVYTYDIVTFSGNMFHRFCAEAHKKHLICAPSVGPGYDAKRGDGDTHFKPRRNGGTYDAMWRAAIASSRRPGHDHVVQRVARGDADRAGCAVAPSRPGSVPLVRRRLGPARPAGGVLVPRPDALLVGHLQEHVRRAAEHQRVVELVGGDAAQLRMREVDAGIRPVGEPERRGSFRRADLEQIGDGDDTAGPGLAARDAFQLAQLFERVDAHVRVAADAHADRAVADARDRQEAVAEVRLGERADADPRLGCREQVELVAVGVRRVHDGRRGTEAAGLVEQLDRSPPVLGQAFVDLARLLVGVDVQWQAVLRRVAPELAERIGRAGAHGVGGDTDGDAVAAERLELAQVVGRPTPGESAGCRRGGNTRRDRRTRSRPPRPLPRRRAPRRGRDSGTRRPR